ncbi:MAG: 1-deoxy-D-xylulose-5-phosphate reductoisomerase [Bacteroidetes bacterium]|nr:1-deoxy-D-xylulose-5-phosphate reductoisomerase [Bacteroidota bacterium]MBX7047201.1 1-deoxy-D-xylulose-5-phosphate reductoisomerase [Ignavibacteria bacterium]
MNNLTILGSTGSIGCSALKVVTNLNRNNYPVKVKYLSTNSRIEALAEQVREFNPSGVVITDETKAKEFRKKFSFEKLEVLSGEAGLKEIASREDYDTLVCALVGFSGLAPVINAIKAGKKIALANKETLVVAGSIVNELLRKHKTDLIPIDSEHSAILQCLLGEGKNKIEKIILTASGGPFRTKSYEEMRNASVEDALNHPNWKMGAKITVDSATMMNKGLEVIEAKWLFDLPESKIEVLIHPQSIIHSMVEFEDSSIKAQLGIPDMKIPIQFALTYPERVISDFPKMNFKNYSSLTFEEPDYKKFECLKIAFDVLREGKTYPVVMNAANEVAIDYFLKGEIFFTDIPKHILSCLEKHTPLESFGLEEIFEIDRQTREISPVKTA